MNIIPGIITFFHDLFTVVWIGGLFFLVIILIPMVKKHNKQAAPISQFSFAIQKRLRIFVLISIIGLWITGMLLSKQNGTGGFLSFTNEYQTILSIKHLLIFGMILMVIWRSVLIVKIEKIPKTEMNKKEKLMKKSMLPVFFNFFFSLTVLLLTGLLSIAS